MNTAPHAGELIGAWLESSGRRPSWLAAKSALSRSHLSLVLSGKRSLSPQAAQRVAGITGIDVRTLLGLAATNGAVSADDFLPADPAEGAAA